MPSARLARAVTDASAGADNADFAASNVGPHVASGVLAVALLPGRRFTREPSASAP